MVWEERIRYGKGSMCCWFFFLMIRRPPRSTPLYSSAASDVYKRQQLRANSNGLLYFSNAQLIDISSSDIRGKIAGNQNLDNLMPSSVINFLQKI